MNEILPLGILGGAVLSAALIGSALLGWLGDLKRMGSATSARETTRRAHVKAAQERVRRPQQPRSAASDRAHSGPRERAREQEDRIREAYFAKERKAREERERRRRQQRAANQRTREARSRASSNRSAPDASGGSEEARHRGTLELRGPATPDSVRAAYRKLIAAYHPDRVATLGAKLQRLAEEETKRINEAYAYFRRVLK